ncbi:hypothetical protein ACLI4Z_04290 [Natrialbaceae archaeon A-arb3/5]
MTDLRRRRQVIGCAGSVLVAGVAGCLEAFDSEGNESATSADRADGPSETGDEADGTASDETASDAGSDDETDGETDDRDGAGSNGDPALVFSVSGTDGNRDAVTTEQVATVGENEFDEWAGVWYVPVDLTEEGTESFADALGAVGAFEEPGSAEIHTHLDGEIVESHRLGPDLAAAMDSGEFDGEFRAMFQDEESAAAFSDDVSG